MKRLPRGCRAGPPALRSWRRGRRALHTALTVVAVAAAAGCASEEGATVARIGGERVLFADFESFVRAQAGAEWMELEEDVLRALFRQFLDDHLLARFARDEGLAQPDADRAASLSALRAGLHVGPIEEEELRRHLESHPEELRRPERLVLGQLLLPDRALAQEAWHAIRARGDFAAVAEEMAERPGVVYGGYSEDVSRRDLPPAFRDVLFALAPGEVSGVLEADYGYHLFHVRERRPEEVLGVAEAAGPALARLEREQADRAVGDMLARARKRYPVEVLDWNLPFLWEVDATSGHAE